MKNKRIKGIESLKSRYGVLFIMPWIIGVVLFFLVPLMQSVLYSLSDVNVTENGMDFQFAFFKNYEYILFKNPDFETNLRSALSSFLYSLPIIVIVSLVLALILNQKFPGRFLFRALYFMPVIIATGIVMEIVFRTTSPEAAANAPEALTDNLFSVADIMRLLDLPGEIAAFVKDAINSIFDIIWSTGIQIVLFIAGLQTIPSSLYEACYVEGATKWEQFWFVTFPMLSRVTMLVSIFTMIELFTDKQNPLMAQAYTQMQGGNYDETSAMLWFYFLIIGLFMGALLAIYNRAVLRRYE